MMRRYWRIVAALRAKFVARRLVYAEAETPDQRRERAREMEKLVLTESERRAARQWNGGLMIRGENGQRFYLRQYGDGSAALRLNHPDGPHYCVQWRHAALEDDLVLKKLWLEADSDGFFRMLRRGDYFPPELNCLIRNVRLR